VWTGSKLSEGMDEVGTHENVQELSVIRRTNNKIKKHKDHTHTYIWSW